VELAIYTHLPYSGTQGAHDLSRNHINVLSSAAIVALPGEAGTASEVALAVRYGKPVIAFSPDLKLVERFPQQARRVDRIDAVREFLRPYTSET
jgi:predicted Rossmann-fold nucleotide-binding protein